ncbi:hypothetical protein P9112_005990 [Eukaryota sp. TZLM1-RC]
MTALTRWVFKISVLVALWVSSIFALHQFSVSPTAALLIKLSPVLAVFLFGLYALLSVLIGAARCKNVPEEADALQKDLQEAKQFYQAKGYKFS